MRKIWVILFALLCCLMFTACGGGTAQNQDSDAAQVEANVDDGVDEIEYAEPIVIVDNEDLKIIATGKFYIHGDDIADHEARAGFYVVLENKTEDTLQLSAEHMSIDGFMLNGYMWFTDRTSYYDITAGMKGKTKLHIRKDTAAENEIDSLDDFINVTGEIGMDYRYPDHIAIGDVFPFENVLP